MNKKTRLSISVPNLLYNWKNYRKSLNLTQKTEWCISSDYCFDNPNKLDVATFTIFPKAYISQIVKEINTNLPHDIKEIKYISPQTVNFLNSKYFFSISIVVDNLKNFFDEDKAFNDITNAMKDYQDLQKDLSTKENKDRYDKIQYLYNYLKKKSHSKKLLSQIYFVAQSISQILEFLIIKENSKSPHWCSDRDHITSWNNGILFDLVNMYTYMYVNNRVSDYRVFLPAGINNKGNFDFDPLIRVPDIITGVVSSLKMTEKGLSLDKEKHFELFNNVIIGNERIIILEVTLNETGMFKGQRVFHMKA